MKSKTFCLTATLLAAAAVSAVVVSACARSAQHEKDSNISYYTCTMHPQVHKDHPGNCPICGMKLVPVYKDAGTGASPGASSLRISPERQQLIGIKTAKAEKKPAVREIRTTGRVAFDPELAVAQREFLEISKNVPSLKDAARSNLRLKGMSEEEIRELDVGTARPFRGAGPGRGNPAPTDLYLPDANGPIWIYATLFQDEMDLVHPGDAAAVSLPSDPASSFDGTVKAVDPVLDAMTRSARARILVENGGGKIRPNTYVNVTMKSDLGESLVIPSSAVLDSGTRRIAFVKKGDAFETREIETGAKVGDGVVVVSGVQEGEDVVTGAAFLVDSESQLKAALP